MNIALAKLKRAAESLRKERKQVSANALAHTLKVKTHTVESYLKGVKGLKEELGISFARGDNPQASKYQEAIRRLCEADMIITYSRIARLASSTTKATSTWCGRHPQYLDNVSLVPEYIYRQHCLRQRIRWYVRMRASSEKKVCITHVAHAVGVERSGLQRFLKQNPDFRKEMGI